VTDIEIITIDINVAYDAQIGEVLAMIQRHDGLIEGFIAHRADVDPNLLIKFDHYVLAENFLMEYCGDTDVESYQI
jgi:hypothetical protein